MSIYNYSAQAVYTADNGGAIRILVTHNGLTWDYYLDSAQTTLSYTLQAGQAINTVQWGTQYLGPGQNTTLTFNPNGQISNKFKYQVDTLGGTVVLNFAMSDCIGGTVNFTPEQGASPIQLVVDGSAVAFTSSIDPAKEYQVTATWDATNEMYIIVGANGGSNYSSFITGAHILQPNGGTVKYRMPQDPTNNPPFAEGSPLYLTPKQVGGVFGFAFDNQSYKDLNFSLTGKTIYLSYDNPAYGGNLSTSVVEGGSAVSVILTGTHTLKQERNDSFSITSANVTPTSLSITWDEPTFYTADAYQYKLVLSYYNTVLSERIDTEEFVASNVFTKTWNGFFADTTISVCVVPWYTIASTAGPKSEGIVEATTSAITGPVPDAVTITSVTPSASGAVINFTAPNTNGSTIEYYLVTLVDNDKVIKTTQVVAGTTPITLTGLDSSTSYDITVTAISNNGQGGTSSSNNFSTSGGGGGGGGSVTLTFVSSTSTTATFTINSTLGGTWTINNDVGGLSIGTGSLNSIDTEVTINISGLTPSTNYVVNATVSGKGGNSVTTVTTTSFSTQAGGGGGGGGALQAGISSTYGAGTATKISYTPLVEISLDNNDINLVDAHAYGHRVQVGVPQSAINGVFSWSRASGASAPTASCDASGLVALLDAAIASGFTDLDAVATGLSFSSTSLDSATDARLRASGSNSANDIVMAYVLYKLYGASAYDTIDNVFNLEDAHGMLDNETLKTALYNSISTNGAAITKMFKNLISSDPQRFFDASGKQVAGIFETNADASGSGNWNLTVGDIVEIRVKFTFGGTITRRDVANQQLDAGVATTNNLAAGEVFYVRFQLVVQA